LAGLAFFIQSPDKLNDFADVLRSHDKTAGSKNNFETGNIKAVMCTPTRILPIFSLEPVIGYPLLPQLVVFREFLHLEDESLFHGDYVTISSKKQVIF